jgi:hypothetical protein
MMIGLYLSSILNATHWLIVSEEPKKSKLNRFPAGYPFFIRIRKILNIFTDQQSSPSRLAAMALFQI